jgi:hypothetical protein
MNKVLVCRKNGHNLWAEVNPVSKRLYNFSISGPSTNSRYTYTHLSEAEAVFNKHTGTKK